MVFNATINNISVISWRSVLLMEETGVSGENHRPVSSHWQTLSQTDGHVVVRDSESIAFRNRDIDYIIVLIYIEMLFSW
jgi:hypothetical protein